MQLAQDIKGSVDELDLPVEVGFIHGRSGDSKTAVGPWKELKNQTCDNHGYMRLETSVRPRVETIRYCHFAYTINNSSLRRLAQVGLTNPLTVAYDLMPWTWVFDWVLPLGSWINSLDATVGLSWVDGCYGEIRKESFEAQVGRPVFNTSLETSNGEFMPVIYPQGWFKRTKLYQQPNVFETFPEPRSPFRDPLWKIATLAALIGQRKKK